MALRSALTILLITRQHLVRADFTLKPAFALKELWTQPRPDLPDLPTLAEAAQLLGPKLGRQVWVLAADLWTQTLELPAHKTTGLSGNELSAALNFEAEVLSGQSAFDSVVGQRSLGTRDSVPTYTIVQARSADVEMIDSLVRKAGGKLCGIAHPGGLPRALSIEPDAAQPWQRVELWPDAVVALHCEPPRPADVQVFNSDPQLGRWKNEVDHWRSKLPNVAQREVLVDAGIDVPAETDGQRLYRLDNEAALSVWVTGIGQELLLKEPGLALIRPVPLPWAPSQRRRLTAVLVCVALLACLAHYHWGLVRRIEAANADRVRFAEPGVRLAELEKRTKDQQAALEKLQQEINELKGSSSKIAMQRQRLSRLLEILADQKATDLLVQKIDNESGDPRIHGVCLSPDLADQFARALTEKLRPYGWEVLPPRKQAKSLVTSGAPWEFDIVCKTPVDPATAPNPRGRGPATSGKP